MYQIPIILLTKYQALELYFAHYHAQMMNDEIDVTSLR